MKVPQDQYQPENPLAQNGLRSKTDSFTPIKSSGTLGLGPGETPGFKSGESYDFGASTVVME